MPPPPPAPPPSSRDLLDELAERVEIAELEAELVCRHDDLAAGLVPPGVNRSLFPHEIAARTNFAAMAAGLDQLAEDLTATLQHTRARFLELLQADLAAQPTVAAAYRRLLDLRVDGVTAIPGVTELLDASHAAVSDSLFGHALTAAEQAGAEAAAQGVAAGVAVLDTETIVRLDDQAARLANGPVADLLRAVQEEATAHRFAAANPVDFAQGVRDLAATLSPASLEEYAASAGAQVAGAARAGTAERIGTPAAVYASELLDGNTCGPCSLVDGHRYETVAAARVDYPTGTYAACAGGPRCRGTLVFVWDAEAAPGVDTTTPPEPPTIQPTPPQPAPQPEPPPQLAPQPEPIAEPIADVLAPEEPTAAELEDARADIPRLRAQVRAHALDVQADAAAFFDASDTATLRRPPTASARDTQGRIVRGPRDTAANYDWFDGLHPDEQRRLRRRFMADPHDPVTPDVLVDHLTRTFGLDDETRALNEWLHQTRRHDAAGAVTRGRLPAADAYGGVDVNNLVDTPYNLRLLFDADLDTAARHVAEVNTITGEEEAARVFSSVRPGFQPPWAMTEQDYVAELADLETRAAAAVPVSDEGEFGLTYSREDQAVFTRLDELVPRSLDDPQNPLPANQLHQVIVAMARRARLVP